MDMNQLWEFLDAEVAATPMPKEYENYFVDILCKDCHKVTCVPALHTFGFLGTNSVCCWLWFPGIDGQVPRGRAQVYALWRLQYLPDKDESD